MPLPSGNLDWPPVELAAITPAMDRWSAWYAGDPAALEAAYARQDRLTPRDRPSTYRGGLVGAVARTFWGAPRGNLEVPKHKLHVPLAADLCQASADLLFSEPPTMAAEKRGVTDRLAELVDDGMLGTLAEAAELAAALGGTYLRATWDRDLVTDGPFATAVDADGAWPEFRWGRLTAVTFWTIVRRDDQKVWRHLERHELRGGTGVVLHGLYEGTPDKLGRTVPLTEVTATAGLANIVTDGNVVDTQTPGLAVTYIPNQRPQRRWRHDPLGRHLGRSDLDGIEGLMDALDEAWTSWMRDIRLGKARVFAARSMLEDGQIVTLADGSKRKMPATFDSDREVYAPLDLPPNAGAAGSGLPIQAEQFKIRNAEHQATVTALMVEALRTAGYSSQTFGESSDQGPDATATEIRARERRSYMTRDRKLRHWRPGLTDFLTKLLTVDAVIFNGPGSGEDLGLSIEFGDAVQESPLALAQTSQALRTAEAASTETLVAMNHPDWDDKRVQDEVSKILAERPAAMPDPFGGIDGSVTGGQDPTGDAAGDLGQ